MLVLSRQKSESIVIGEGENRVEVMVTEIRGDKVRLGVTAPKNIPIHRKEVQEVIDREKREKSE